MRICTKCNAKKSLEEFPKDKKGPLGHSCRCKSCAVKLASSWQKANKEKRAKTILAWKSRNPDKMKAIHSNYVKTHQSERNAHRAKRRAQQIKAIPKWADLSKIKEFYKNRPKGFHVDHIIPLQGRNVCGLHTIENLQYLPALANISKGNRHG